MDTHKVIREGDEQVCSCGLRWGIGEDDPHPHSHPVAAEDHIDRIHSAKTCTVKAPTKTKWYYR